MPASVRSSGSLRTVLRTKSRLQSLHLGGTQADTITASAVVAALRSPCCSLSAVCLSGHMSDAAVTALAQGLHPSAPLRELWLGGNFGDAAGAALAAALATPRMRLRLLALGGAACSDVSLRSRIKLRTAAALGAALAAGGAGCAEEGAAVGAEGAQPMDTGAAAAGAACGGEGGEGGEGGGTGETRLTVAAAAAEERVELTAAGERIVVRPQLPLAPDAVECADPEVAKRVTGLLTRVQRASLPLS